MAKKPLSTSTTAARPARASKSESKKRKRPFISTRFRDFKCGHVYHIYQRGNHRRPVFRTDVERLTYLEHMLRFARRYSVKIHNFCLMGTHVHLVLEQREKKGISNMMRDLQSGHAREQNRRLHTFGNLWTQHFGCKPVKNDAQYQTLMWYVANNPVKTGSCNKADEYLWSGAQIHAKGGPVVLTVGARELKIELYMDKWEKVCNTPEWKKRMLAGDVPAIMAEELKEIELILDGEARREEGNRQRIKELNAKKQKEREKKANKKKLGTGRALQVEAEAKKKAVGAASKAKSAPKSMHAG